MSHRNPRRTDFAGKTIKHVDTRACNVWTFHFTDGTKLAIETEHIGHGLYGMVVCDTCAMPAKKAA